jgi:hypothetical protein
VNPQTDSLYSFSGVVHRLGRSTHLHSVSQTVNNAVGPMNLWRQFCLLQTSGTCYFWVGLRYEQTVCAFDASSAIFDRSRNLNADTHSQVMTPNVSHYTACAPRLLPNAFIP